MVSSIVFSLMLEIYEITGESDPKHNIVYQISWRCGHAKAAELMDH